MKNLFGYAIVLSLAAMPLVSLAAEFRAGDQPSVGAAEQISGDLYMGGGSVTSAGNISGDLIVGGGNIAVSGNVAQDVIAGGGNVNILSDVGDDVRAGGGNVYIGGKVGGDVIAGGGQITISGAGVGGDVVVGGGMVRIDAPVAGKVSFGGGNIYINAPIAGDIKIEADKVTLGSRAVISGNLTYKASSPLVQESGAVVTGIVVFEPLRDKMLSHAALAAIASAFLVWQFFALLACAMLVGLVFRRFGREIIRLAGERPLFEIGRGIVALASIFVVSILLLITLVGVPLGILGFLSFFSLILFTWMVTPIMVGSFVHRYFWKGDLEVNWKTILIGAFAYTLLGVVPFIGWIVQKLLVLLTLGCIIALKSRILKEWR